MFQKIRCYTGEFAEIGRIGTGSIKRESERFDRPARDAFDEKIVGAGDLASGREFNWELAREMGEEVVEVCQMEMEMVD